MSNTEEDKGEVDLGTTETFKTIVITGFKGDAKTNILIVDRLRMVAQSLKEIAEVCGYMTVDARYVDTEKKHKTVFYGNEVEFGTDEAFKGEKTNG